MIPRRTLLAAATLAPLAGCATAPKAKTPTELKLVTFNIWHNLGDWTARRPLLIAALTRVEAITVRQAAGIAIAFAGTAHIVFAGEWARVATIEFAAGDVIAVAAAILWAVFSFQMKRLPREIHPLATTACCAAVGLVLLGALYAAWGLSGRPWLRQEGAVLADGGAALLVAYIAIGPSLVGNLAFTAGVQRVGAATAGALLYLTPVVATVLAVTVLGETLRLFHAVGIAGIATGLVMATRRG